ncbi:MAG: dimethyladenosine transferase, partial [Actinomycetota bacterium]
DGSGSVSALRGGSPPRLSQGARFGMDMRLGARYRITNTVVEFVEGGRIAWRHFYGHRWRYEFADADAGTRVTETFDWSRARSRLALELAGFPRKNFAAMHATLARLEQLAVDGETRDAA